MRLPYFRQRYEYSCGAACLRMVFAYHGMRLREEKIARLSRTSARNGTPLINMKKACFKLGFGCFSCRDASLGDVRHFLKRGLPVIVNYSEPSEGDDHYALVVNAGKRFVVLNDPWNGRSFKLRKGEFLKRWWGWSSDGRSRVRRWLMVVTSRDN